MRIINTLEEIGQVMGCCKIILDCSKDNIGVSFDALRCASPDADRVVQPFSRNAGESRTSDQKAETDRIV